MSKVVTQDLINEKRKVVESLPTKADIFLPTERIGLEDQVLGLKAVKELYENDLHQHYSPKLRRLKASLKNRKRCFLIGNGPSLNDTDLSVLKDEVTFAVNGFFLKEKELDWTPTFYLVEDHLVAEDRKNEIASFKGPIKLFPAYLRYCLPESEDTIFYNHRPRISYPDGFDFSMAADEITYAGCTVMFSAMQMAAYFGFEEIYLIGVDADYDIPSDASTEGEGYGTSVLDMDSDDTNHFHPDYFGKGYRWHDPQVSKMIEAYQEAKKVTDLAGLKIYNATVGGKLEVFPRRNYLELFGETSNEIGKEGAESSALPNLLLIDFTRMGQGTATGELKSHYFAGWSPDKLFHIYGEGGRSSLGVSHPKIAEHKRFSQKNILEKVNEFAPDIILYRPVAEHDMLHHVAKRLISDLEKPYGLWLMDDWPAKIALEDKSRANEINKEITALCQSANYCFAISEPMAGAFGARYGAVFDVFHNGINSLEAPKKDMDTKSALRSDLKFRYAGALSEDMTWQSIADIANAIEALNREGYSVSLDILTGEHWRPAVDKILEGKKSVSARIEKLSKMEYGAWLNEADVLIIANNFDATSRQYLKYSFANKTPECLAFGGSVLSYGPLDNATMHFLSNVPGVFSLNERNIDLLKRMILKFIENPKLLMLEGKKSREYAFNNLQLNNYVRRFEKVMRREATSTYNKPSLQIEEIHDVNARQLRDITDVEKAKKMDIKKGYVPVLRAFKNYIIGWKGGGGVLSVLSMCGAFLLIGKATSSMGYLYLAASLAGFSQILLFLLIAHLAAHMNSRR